MDVGHWTHPRSGEQVQFVIVIDEGSRFRIARILTTGSKQQPNAAQCLDYLQEGWTQVFGKPEVLRLDPAGAFRSRAVEAYCDRHSIFLDLVPADAHWQIGVCEQAIKGIKHVMARLVAEDDQLSSKEALSLSVETFNNREQIRGYTPVQHAFGRNPDVTGRFVVHPEHLGDDWRLESADEEFIRSAKARASAEKALSDWQAQQRITRAMNSKGRPAYDYVPGELVFFWRTQESGQGRRQPGTSRGRFLGPARILATETRKEPDGSLRPGSAIWLVRGRSLLKCCPEQLRRASSRETLLESLAQKDQQEASTPWTFHRVVEEVGGNRYEDITAENPSPEEWNRAQDVREELPPTRFRIRGKRLGPEPVENEEMISEEAHTPSAPSRPVRPRTRGPTTSGETPQAWWSELEADHFGGGSSFWADQPCAVEVSIDLPDSVRGKEKAIDNLYSFFAGALKRQAVEVSERRLSEADKQGFKEAKSVEVKNFLAARAFEALPPEYRPDRSQAVGMRWVLTWKLKDDGSRKPKARAVLLGYQDPSYEHRSTTAPVMTRQTRQLLLQVAANRRWSVYKGDVSGAFLQGRDYPDHLLCAPCDEICEAMSLPRGSIVRLRKACYGLVDAPLEWYRTVSAFLEEQGFQRLWSDACAWTLREGSQLLGVVSGHVDDFLFSGEETHPKWKSAIQAIQARFKWGDWDKDNFVQCGVQISREGADFKLSQKRYVEEIKEIPVNALRKKDLKAPTSEREKTQLRALLGALSWNAQQVSPHTSADVSLLLSEIPKSTVETILRANNLLFRTKARSSHEMIIHGFPDERDLGLYAWVDAASQNRDDGGSTQGIVVGMGEKGMLQGQVSKISVISWHSNKIDRTCRSPGASETIAAVNGEDILYFIRYQWAELLYGGVDTRNPDETVRKVQGTVITDSRNVFDKLCTEVLVVKGAEKKANLELLSLKESQQRTSVNVRWVHSEDAGLDNTEKSLVQATIGENYTMKSVTQALRTYFSDAELRKRDHGRRHHGFLGDYANDEEDDDGEAQDLNFVANDLLTDEGYAAWSAAQIEVDEAMAAIQHGRTFLLVFFFDSFYVETTRALSASPSTSDAVQQGKAVIDSGATRSIGSVQALERIMMLNYQRCGEARVSDVNHDDRPVFGFGNSSSDHCVSTVTLRISAGGKPGAFNVHALDKGCGPVLMSIEALRALGAIVDYEKDLMVLRRVDARRLLDVYSSTPWFQTIMSGLTRKELQAKLEEQGESVPSGWTKVEMLLRIEELTGINQASTVPAKTEKSDYQELVQNLNKASRKKSELQAFCAAMIQIYTKKTVPEPTDVMGFGCHSKLKYSEVKANYPEHCTWVVTTAREGQCDPRLRRFAGWLENNVDQVNRAKEELEARFTESEKRVEPAPKKAAPKKKMMGYSSSSSSQVEDDSVTLSGQQLRSLVETIEGLKEEVASLKEVPLHKDNNNDNQYDNVLIGQPPPRNLSSLDVLPPKWKTVSMDVGHWTHPRSGEQVQFVIVIDEGSRFRIARILTTGSKQQPNAAQCLDYLQEGWTQVFGKPEVLRLDPAGAFRSRAVEAYCDRHSIFLDLVPADAHWQIGVCEQAIKGIKHVMARLVAEDDQLSSKEALSLSVETFNNREQIRGYTPVQHAFGRNPDVTGRFVVHPEHLGDDWRLESADEEFIRSAKARASAEKALSDWQAQQRITRAMNSKGRPAYDYVPGELVFFWRTQESGQGRRQPGTSRGRFLGPARILATETRKEPDGSLRPGSAIWLVRGRSLLKCCPEQLRRASSRETLLESLAQKDQQEASTPWTFHRVVEEVGGNRYEDITAENPSPEEWNRAQDVREELPPTRFRIRGKRLGPEPVENEEMISEEAHTPSAPSRPVRPRTRGPTTSGETPQAWWSELEADHFGGGSSFWADQPCAVEVSIDLPDSVRGKEKAIDNLYSFFAGALKRQAVEVSERRLSEADKQGFKEAKSVEVKNFLAARAFEALPPEYRPDRSQAVGMRWVLTWKLKDDGSRKPKVGIIQIICFALPATIFVRLCVSLVDRLSVFVMLVTAWWTLLWSGIEQFLPFWMNKVFIDFGQMPVPGLFVMALICLELFLVMSMTSCFPEKILIPIGRASETIAAVNGAQLANSLTKWNGGHELELFYKMQSCWRIVEDPEMMSARRRSPSGSVRSLVSSRAGSQNRFIPPDEEERLVIKGEQERVRAEARERREQLREAQKLQAEEEHLLRLQRRTLDREAQKQRLEAERFEKWREKLEHRDMARAKLWEKSPKVADQPARSPRNSLVSVSPSPSGRSQSPRSQLQVPYSPGLSPSSSFAALVSPRQRVRSWDMNIATYTREEVHTLERERRAELADKEVRVLRDREARSKERSRQEVSFDKLHVRRTAELEEIRVAREAKKQQEIQKRRRDREQKQEVRAMHRAGEVGTKEYEEMAFSGNSRQNVYEKQQSEEEASSSRVYAEYYNGDYRHFHLRLRIADAACIWLAVLPSTGGELWLGGIVASGLVSVLQENNISSILAATSKPPVAKVLGCIECDDEDHRAQGSQALREIVSLAPVGKSWSPAETEQGIKEREAEAVRDARESAKEELRRRRILDLEQKRAKVLAVKADQEERKKRREEEKCYIYTPAPRLSDKVKAAAAEAMAQWDAQFTAQTLAAQVGLDKVMAQTVAIPSPSASSRSRGIGAGFLGCDARGLRAREAPRHGEGIAHGLGAVLSFTIADAIPRGDCPTEMVDRDGEYLKWITGFEHFHVKHVDCLDETVETLSQRAQMALGVGKGRLLDSCGVVLDGCLDTKTSRIQNGDTLTLHVKGVQIQSSDFAFAAILGDGSVVTWGDARHGGDSGAVQGQLKNVQQIQATRGAFAAVLANGSVVTWGDAGFGGDSTAVQDQLRTVQQVQASGRAFAAILGDGSVVTWGAADHGGDSSAVQGQLKNVQQIQATRGAFAAILGDGSVVTWGAAGDGGDSSAVQGQLNNVQQVQASGSVFAAILGDGSVVTWGNPGTGGNCSVVQSQLKNVQQIQASRGAFAAILGDGSVVTWGLDIYGGDSSAVQDELKTVQQVQASGRAFAAVLGDGSVVTWGAADHGGDSSAVQVALKNVQQIQAAATAFAAILDDGSVVTWGIATLGGDSSAWQGQLKTVQHVHACGGAFAAILGDGSVVTWGQAKRGGDSSAVQAQLKTVQQIQASVGAFAAILGDGSVVTWGAVESGGDSSAVQDQLKTV
ncbi:Retrovirus-related Pol polyprotein from transposon TNT 1-94 [Symbiodinium microadriaticum]|uniref:Gag-Pol-p199 n=1 Tax=Symbiodinium microadriaticum TaxID=2951 RepID=A0A1Q9ELL4_SYMMI|nr:Retrovirus-related Pol polyprotein from transposon TNT 1-94 [Symbiodinium microadriaticum]